MLGEKSGTSTSGMGVTREGRGGSRGADAFGFAKRGTTEPGRAEEGQGVEEGLREMAGLEGI